MAGIGPYQQNARKGHFDKAYKQYTKLFYKLAGREAPLDGELSTKTLEMVKMYNAIFKK